MYTECFQGIRGMTDAPCDKSPGGCNFARGLRRLIGHDSAEDN